LFGSYSFLANAPTAEQLAAHDFTKKRLAESVFNQEDLVGCARFV
jgi:hypothetical protein